MFCTLCEINKNLKKHASKHTESELKVISRVVFDNVNKIIDQTK